MYKYLLLLLLVLSGCRGAEAASSQTDIAAMVSKTVALVDHEGTGDIDAFCSGVWVSSATILTAAHCVDDHLKGETIQYAVYSDVYAPNDHHERFLIGSHRATLFALDEAHDLALLVALDKVPSHAVALVAKEVHVGQRVQTMGMPLGLWWCYSSGDVAALRNYKSHGYDILFIQDTAPISGGNSGGPLFDSSGEILGIAHAQFPSGQNLNLHIHFSQVEAFLKAKMTF